MENNLLDLSHTEIEVFVGHLTGDALWPPGNESLELIRTKVYRLWPQTNDG